MKKILNFTSKTTTVRECFTMLFSRTKKSYRQKYHDEIKKVIPCKFVLSYGAGRMALYELLRAMGVGKGDEVILQGYTCVAVPKAIMYLGAVPIYADISLGDYNIEFNSVKEKITDRTKVIIAQHTYGIPCHCIWDLKELCQGKNIYLIEDCAHLFGAKYEGKILGTIGDAAFFSTDHTKFISTSIGGIAVTDNATLGNRLMEQYQCVDDWSKKEMRAIRCQLLIMHTLKNQRLAYFFGLNKFTKLIESGIWFVSSRLKLMFYMNDYTNLEFPQYTFPAKLAHTQAKIGISQLSRLNDNTASRERITKVYRKMIGEDYAIPIGNEALLRIPILTDNPDDFCYALKSQMRVERWFSPAIECIKESDFGKFCYSYHDCPNAKFAAEHIVNLPCHPQMKIADAINICNTIKEYFGHENK